ncbi:MAG TPA: hypothetical protein VL728_07465 [Cyclobacteriaceae bacterium]|jgi:hypothetical protein|nr:hypothetical protein [Cyclobacteriaceae bacterium]
MIKNLFAVLTLFLSLAGCAYNDITPAQEPLPFERGEFIFGRTDGPDQPALAPYNVFKLAGGKLYGAYILHHLNPDSLELYPMQVLSSDKYQIASSLRSLLPEKVFSETGTLIGRINIDSGYDFIKVSLEAGATKFFYIGDAGYPDYLSAFKQALDEDLVKLRQ